MINNYLIKRINNLKCNLNLKIQDLKLKEIQEVNIFNKIIFQATHLN